MALSTDSHGDGAISIDADGERPSSTVPSIDKPSVRATERRPSVGWQSTDDNLLYELSIIKGFPYGIGPACSYKISSALGFFYRSGALPSARPSSSPHRIRLFASLTPISVAFMY